MTAAKMDVPSKDDSLTDIGKYFAILIFVDHTVKYHKNWMTAKISAYTVLHKNIVYII